MKTYLAKEYDWNRPDLVSQYDEISLWCAPFAKLLLDHVPLADVGTYLDIGCGTGFPLLDLTQRLGTSCTSIGIDPWESATQRCQDKIRTLGLRNIQLMTTGFEQAALPDSTMDLITSCLGVNNFSHPEVFFERSWKWLKPSGTLAITTNLTGTFEEFYDLFAKCYKELGIGVDESEFLKHIHHRGDIDSYQAMIQKAGFGSTRIIESEFNLRYASGTAFFHHSVISSGFLGAWKNLVPEAHRETLFSILEERINEHSKRNGEFSVTIPTAYLECKK